MSTYGRIAELPVEIDSYTLEGLAIQPSPEFERLTTVVQMLSDGLVGNGEDITYEALDAIALQDAGPVQDLTGPRTIGEFCELIGGLDFFPAPPEREVSRLYRRWAFESAALDLTPHMDRVTWDAPIHSVEEIEALEYRPKVINIKPSRMGGLKSTFDAYDFCDREGIGAYGGGQWELGVGREQIQYLAALLHPDNPNDTAPRGYNAAVPEPGLPTSPMEVPQIGFGIPH